MKRVYSIIAMVVAVTVWFAMPAYAAKLDVGGELRARGYYIQSEDFTETGDANWLDARLRMNAMVKQGMTTGVVQVDFLEASSAKDGDSSGILVLGNDTGNSYSLIKLRQAYLAINFPVLTVIGGRYEAKLGNGLILNDTVDLVAVAAPVGPVNLLVGYLVLGEDDGPSNTPTSANILAGDDTAFAVNLGIKNVGGMGWDFSIFGVSAALNSVSKSLGTEDDTKLQVFGLTGNGKVGPVGVAAELDLLTGDAANIGDFKGTNILLSGSAPVGPVTLAGAFLYATGQEDEDLNINTIDGDFRASNILVRDDFNNYEGVTSLSVGSGKVTGYTVGGVGLTAVKVAATLQPMKLLMATHTPEVGLVWAQASEDDVDGDDDLGTEIYLNTNCKFDENLSGNVGIAFVSAGDALVPGADAEDQLKLEAELTFHF